MKECDIFLVGVKTYSDRSNIWPGPQPPMIYARGPRRRKTLRPPLERLSKAQAIKRATDRLTRRPHMQRSS